MNHLGISCGFHDAGVCLIDEHGDINYASHSERYSKHKNDKELHEDQFKNLKYDFVHYYEKPWLKQLRRARAGQNIEWKKSTSRKILKQFI